MNRKSIFSLILLLALPLLAQALPAPAKPATRMRKFGKRVVRPVRTPRGKPEKFVRQEISSLTANRELRLNLYSFKERNITSYTGARLKATGKTISRKINKVEKQSAQANKTALARLRTFADLAAVEKKSNEALMRDAFRFRKKVFEVQISDNGRHTASAFAINVNGRVWGVTAAHVMKNISSDPFIKIKNVSEVVLLAPIQRWHIGNKKGNDVAIFEIPQEVLTHIEVLSPASELPAAGIETQSPAFVRGNYTFLPSEDVLFAGPHRIFLRDQLLHDVSGYCGSPVLVDGKVAGLHTWVHPLERIQTSEWISLLHQNNLSLKIPLHEAMPIQRVLQLIEEVENPQNSGGTMLKVSGHPVHLLTSQEHLVSITHMRNGRVQKNLNSHPFINFEHLEEFFELQENDVVRVTLESPKPYSQKVITRLFDINVSTGEITQIDR